MHGVATLFNDNWEFKRTGDDDWTSVNLPHDAMLWEGRREDAPGGKDNAFHIGGSYIYRKAWRAPASVESKVVALSFDGVYRHSRVLVNGKDAGGCLAGWTKFEVRIDQYLKQGQLNTIEVHVDNSQQPAARWYTGSGIHRSVHLMVRNHNLLRRDGIRLSTLSVDGPARLALQILLDNDESEDVEVALGLSRAGQEVMSWRNKTIKSEIRQEFEIPNPALWSAENPNLYDCTVVINDDVYFFSYGVRTLEVKPGRGFLVNGQVVLLRGGCVHADNGILGAISLQAAEMRRLSILKKTGFNAVRMSHHPCSEVFLQACDKLGMYVMDEFADYWYDTKSTHDESGTFLQRWEFEVASMVERARNHPSVIMYSLGNEITEPRTAYGHTVAQRLLDYQRQLDPTRPNTIAVNLMLATLAYSKTPPGDPNAHPATEASSSLISSSLINVMLSVLLSFMRYIPSFNRCNVVTEQLFSYMSIAGYNYGSVRYPKDAQLHPDRMMLGTETCPPDHPMIWDQVERIPNLIGDFMWTAWDYIGELGVGEHDFSARWYMPVTVYKPWPYLVAGCGALDINGVPNANAFVAQAGWKVLSKPVIAVRPLDVSDLYYKPTPWRASDAIEGWGWKGRDGQMAYIEVISQEEEIELFLNGRLLGRASNSKENSYTAKFSTPYEPGELLAIAYSAKKERSRSTLRSADSDSTTLNIVNEKIGHLITDGQDLAYLRLELSDHEGNIEMNDDDCLTVEVRGDATLAGLGSACNKNLERFDSNAHKTWRGRALAVIRSGRKPGDVVVSVSSVRHGSASVTIKQSE